MPGLRRRRFDVHFRWRRCRVIRGCVELTNWIVVTLTCLTASSNTHDDERKYPLLPRPWPPTSSHTTPRCPLRGTRTPLTSPTPPSALSSRFRGRRKCSRRRDGSWVVAYTRITYTRTTEVLSAVDTAPSLSASALTTISTPGPAIPRSPRRALEGQTPTPLAGKQSVRCARIAQRHVELEVLRERGSLRACCGHAGHVISVGPTPAALELAPFVFELLPMVALSFCPGERSRKS